MSSLKLTAVFASILIALIVAWGTGFVARGLIPSEKLTTAAYPIGVEAKAAAAAPALAAAPAKPDPITAEQWAKADPVQGEQIAKKCGACHDFTKGGPNKVGPNLYGIVGNKRAHLDNFQFSDAIKKLGGTWTPQEIAAFIFNPKAYAPGTKMGFPGLPKAEDRADVIAYLNKNSDAPVDLAK